MCAGDTLHLMHCIDIPMAPPATEVYSAATSLTGPEKPPDLPPQVEAELLNTARDKITSLYSRQLEAASVRVPATPCVFSSHWDDSVIGVNACPVLGDAYVSRRLV